MITHERACLGACKALLPPSLIGYCAPTWQVLGVGLLRVDDVQQVIALRRGGGEKGEGGFSLVWLLQEAECRLGG